MNIPDSRCSKSQLNQVAQADKVAVHNAGGSTLAPRRKERNTAAVLKGTSCVPKWLNSMVYGRYNYSYHLVMTNIAMENHYYEWVNHL